MRRGGAGYRWRAPWEVQELIRKAMIDEDQRTGWRVQGYEQRNDPADLGKHPLKKKTNTGIVFPVGLSTSVLHVAPLLHLFLLGKKRALKGESSVPIWGTCIFAKKSASLPMIADTFCIAVRRPKWPVFFDRRRTNLPHSLSSKCDACIVSYPPA